MRVFVDTSALFAVLDADDHAHPPAAEQWTTLIEGGDSLHCTNYVLVETVALVQRRLGVDAVRAFAGHILPVLTVHWVDSDVHGAAIGALLTAGRRDLSLVDCVSFELMRRAAIEHAFTFDGHFREQGFRTLPAT